MRNCDWLPGGPLVATETPGSKRMTSLVSGMPSWFSVCPSRMLTEAGASAFSTGRREAVMTMSWSASAGADAAASKSRSEFMTFLHWRHTCRHGGAAGAQSSDDTTRRRLVPAGRGRQRRQVSWLCGSLPGLPVVERGSPLTVAGTAPELHRLPIFTALLGRHLRLRRG